MFRIRMGSGRTALVRWAIVSAGVVALTAFSGSYQHQYQLLVQFGQAHWYAAVQPLSVEGLVFTATLMMALAAMLKKQAREVWPAYLALVIGTGQAALANIAVSYPAWWWMRIEINVWPAVAFFIAYEMVSWMIRARSVQANVAHVPSAAPPTPNAPPEVAAEDKPPTVEVAGHTFTYADVEIPESDDLPDDEPEVTVTGSPSARGSMFDGYQVPVRPLTLVNGSEPVHTCNGGQGPKGGKKTPGCPRCDAILAGTIAPKGARRK
jgi:hypothetical protein